MSAGGEAVMVPEAASRGHAAIGSHCVLQFRSVGNEMATVEHKVFCVLEFARSESQILVQRAFRAKFRIEPPTRKSISRWFTQFQQTGSVCKRKSTGRPRVSEEDVRRIEASFVRSPRKSTRRASRELGTPHTTVWTVLRRRLLYKPYRLQPVQALKASDKEKRLQFCSDVLGMMEDDTFLPRVVFSDEATFHLSGKVNTHNVRIWGLQNPHSTLQHERDSPKVNVFCAVSRTKVYGPFFFAERTVTGITYLDMLQQWLFPQIMEDSQDFIFQQDGAPPHWHLHVRDYLNESLPHRWIGRGADADQALHFWPPRSPDLTPCDYFLWGYVKEAVYVPPLPTTLNNLRQRITAAVHAVTNDMLSRVWDEFGYRVDVCRAANGGHIEHL